MHYYLRVRCHGKNVTVRAGCTVTIPNGIKTAVLEVKNTGQSSDKNVQLFPIHKTVTNRLQGVQILFIPHAVL